MANNNQDSNLGAYTLGGAGIGAASTLLGGALNNILSSKSEREQWERNYNAQKEFAQNSIQWRVQDAQKAGIHPLYAMGNSPGYTPSSVFGTDSMASAVAQAGNQIGEAMGQLGVMNAYLQNDKLRSEIKSSELENNAKELDLINRMSSAALGQKSSAMPHVTGQGETDLYINADGSGRVMPGQMEGEIGATLTDLTKIKDSMYSSDSVEKLPIPKGVDRYYHLSPLGYSYTDLPKGTPKSKLGYWGLATSGYYRMSKGIGKAVDWFLRKFD